MKKGKHIHRNITAKRSEHSICLDVTSTLEVGNKFRYKGYACTVDDITRKLVRFTGTRNEKVGEVTRQMILNVESFTLPLKNVASFWYSPALPVCQSAPSDSLMVF